MLAARPRTSAAVNFHVFGPFHLLDICLQASNGCYSRQSCNPAGRLDAKPNQTQNSRGRACEELAVDALEAAAVLRRRRIVRGPAVLAVLKVPLELHATPRRVL